MSLIKSVFVSARPTTWIRILAEIMFGFAAGGGNLITNFQVLFLGFLVVGPLFTTASYIFNDYTDIELDKQHPLRKNRPIALGLISKRQVLVLCTLLITIASFISITFISNEFLFGVLVLGFFQFLYTQKPFRLKEKFFWDITINGLSAGVRFWQGFLLGSRSGDKSLLFFFVFAVLLKTLLFIGHRLQSRTLERKNDFHSTTSILSLFQIKVLLFIVGTLATLSYIFGSFLFGATRYLLLIPLFVFFVLLIPMVLRVNKGYLQSEEKSLFWRVYLYLCQLVFVVVFYGFVRFLSFF